MKAYSISPSRGTQEITVQRLLFKPLDLCWQDLVNYYSQQVTGPEPITMMTQAQHSVLKALVRDSMHLMVHRSAGRQLTRGQPYLEVRELGHQTQAS